MSSSQRSRERRARREAEWAEIEAERQRYESLTTDERIDECTTLSDALEIIRSLSARIDALEAATLAITESDR